MAAHLFAAIDVGSFELEMGIYETTSRNGLREIDHLRHVISLGRDTYHTGKISYHLVDEMCQVLEEFAQVMKSYQVEDYRAYATSAMREAKNSQIILEQIRVRTGIQVQVISNSEQRFLGYKAIAMKEAEFQKIIQKGTAIADVSFGSLQISLFDKDSLVSTQNIQQGILRLRENLSGVWSDRQTVLGIFEDMVDNELYAFKKMYLKDRDIKNLICIGEKLIQMPVDQIEDRFGVNQEYAHLLIPAAIIYKQILEMTGAEMLWVPGIRMCDGIAADYAEKQKYLKFTHNFDDDILSASRNMAKRYRCNTSHGQKIENYALQIFDAMKKFHGLGTRERLLLQIASILHDCGKFISLRDSSACAYNIIMATEIIGLSHAEREIVAEVVRCNLDAFRYGEGSIRAGKLTAMLRLANAMDRSHHGRLDDGKLQVKGNKLIISTSYAGNLALETMAVEDKADFFEEMFGIRPEIRQKRRV